MGDGSFGKYRLIAELGHGGMADVFLAVMAGPIGSGFSKLTVVKRLRQNLADEPEFVEMLVDEARISARLNHPNVVQTNEVGAVENQYFISMEYLDGQPLHRIQHRAMQKAQKIAADIAMGLPPTATATGHGSASMPPSYEPFPKEQQYLVLVETLAGLHHAHELVDYDGTPLEVVHRDVTPHNIFVTYEGQTKVVDFGIAKAVGRASETRQGVVKGKVRYMAPEQASGQRVDRRADLFSVGVMLWEAATGRRLWKDMEDLNVVHALVGGQIRSSPREIDPTVPEAIDRICRKALAHDVADRYATAEDFRIDLESYLAEAGLLVSARRRIGPAVSELFKDKRTEIKAVIEKQLAQISARSQSELRAVHLEASSGSTRVPSTPSSANQTVTMQRQSLTVALPRSSSPGGLAAASYTVVDSAGPTSMPEPATEVYAGHAGALNAVGGVGAMGRARSVPAPTNTLGSRLPVIIAVVALAVFIGVFAATRGTLFGAATAATAASGASSVAGSAGSAGSAGAGQAADPPTIHVTITTTPANAKVFVDGAPVPVPSDARLPRDGRAHELRVEAPGFDSHVETVRSDSDLALTIPLTEHQAPVASTAKAPAATAQRWSPLAKSTATAAPPPTQATAPTTTPPGPGTAPTAPKMTIDTREDPWATTKPH